MKKALLSLLLLIVASPSYAVMYYNNKVDLKLGGWSYHVKKDNDNYNYNQDHDGFGLEWTFASSAYEQHNFSLGFFSMKDSFGMDNFQGGLQYKFKPRSGIPFIDAIHFNLAGLYMRRGWMNVVDKNDYNKSEFEYREFFVPMPYLTIEPNRYVNMDFMVIPSMNDVTPLTFFVRFGVNLNSIIGF